MDLHRRDSRQAGPLETTLSAVCKAALALELRPRRALLVRGVAQYALLHAGEWEIFGCLNQPMRPLLDYRDYDGQFTYEGCGAGVARVGPLTLLDFPQAAAIELRVAISRLYFDPFATDSISDFSFRHIPPGLLANKLFRDAQVVDWIDLASRCRELRCRLLAFCAPP